MKKSKAVSNTAKLSNEGVVTKATSIVQSMTGNTAFATPNPPLSDITDLSDKLALKLANQKTALKDYQTKTNEVQVAREDLEYALERERSYVEITSDGDKTKILSSGFDVKQDATPVGILPAPINVLLKQGGSDGELIATWKRVKGARSYVVEQSFEVGDSTNWSIIAVVTKAKCFLSGMESGTRCWIRVAAINAAGQGSYSDLATKTVP